MPEIKLESINNPVKGIFSFYDNKELSALNDLSPANIIDDDYDANLSTSTTKQTWVLICAGFDVVDVLVKNVGSPESLIFKILGTKRQKKYSEYTVFDFNIEIKPEETISPLHIATSTPEINNLLKQYYAIAIFTKKIQGTIRPATVGFDISCR